MGLRQLPGDYQLANGIDDFPQTSMVPDRKNLGMGFPGILKESSNLGILAKSEKKEYSMDPRRQNSKNSLIRTESSN